MKKNRRKNRGGNAQGAKPYQSKAHPVVRAIVPIGRSSVAIAAGYLGLLSIFLIPAPFAILISIWAILDLKQNKDKHGWVRTAFGLAMGIVFTAILVIVCFNSR